MLMIAGAGRSGSTLLERMLATAPDVVTVGELTEIWQRGLIDDERCGCGESFRACAFWEEVGGRAFGGWSRVDPLRMLRLERRLARRGIPLTAVARLTPGGRRAIEEYASALARIHAAVGAVSGARTVVDASKWPRHLFVLRAAAVDLRVVHLIRDPRAVAFSWSAETARPHGGHGADGADRASMRTYRPAGSALRWLAFNLLVDLAARRGTTTHRVRYEDIVADPAGLLAELLAYAGSAGASESLPLDAGSRTVQLDPSHGIAGNPMRFRHGPVELRVDERWRPGLTTAQRLAVSAVCGPLNRRYGGRAPTPGPVRRTRPSGG